MADEPSRARGFKQLRERFGEGRLADALLAKWRSDGDADERWAHLAEDIQDLGEEERKARKRARDR